MTADSFLISLSKTSHYKIIYHNLGTSETLNQLMDSSSKNFWGRTYTKQHSTP